VGDARVLKRGTADAVPPNRRVAATDTSTFIVYYTTVDQVDRYLATPATHQ